MSVPKICEVCIAPIVLEIGYYVLLYGWPGAFDLPVYVCVGECHEAALKRIKKHRPRSIKD